MRRASRSIALLIVFAMAVAACGDDGSVLGTGASTTEAAADTTAPGTTEAPPATTEAPPATTEAPPATTATTAAPPATTAPPAPSIPILTPFDASETNASPALVMDIVMPIVSGVPAGAADTMNAMISAEVLGTAANFKTEILTGPPPFDPNIASEIGVSYVGEAVSALILSIRFDVYMYYSGAAHGMSSVVTMNFDPQTGQSLALTDILVPGTFGALASMVEQQLTDDLYGGDAGEAAAWLPVLDESVLDGWAVTTDGLAFSFDQYEVGFGAMGAPTVVIPWGDLGAVIDPGGWAAVYAFGPG
ncbi:MAG: RsiV family protein [Acidimicrobiia bacterium]|nr:RsiV family protein [Acidimicrobiia bacterium]